MSDTRNTVDIELKALRAAAARSIWYALFFVGLQVPMRLEAAREETNTEWATDTLRLALALQIGFAIAVVMSSLRIAAYLHARDRRLVDQALAAADETREPEIRHDAETRRKDIGYGARVLGAAGLVIPIEVWTLRDPVDLGESGWDRVSSELWTMSWMLLIAIGLAYLAGVRFVGVRGDRSWQQAAVHLGDATCEATLQAPPEEPRPQRIITCSGGGIRSASFCLGALQALTRKGVYHSSDAVVGVSGGGYMAAAFHYTGRKLGPSEPPPFAQGTPELALLRRRTRYLLANPTEMFRGLFSVVWGVVVNVVIIAAVLRATAWVLGWYLARFDVVEGNRKLHTLHVDTSGWWLATALAPWAVAIAIFVLHDKVLERFMTTPDGLRRAVRTAIGLGLKIGLATVVLMIGVPQALAGLNELAGSDANLPGFVRAVTSPDDASFGGSLILTITALITLGRTVWKGLETAETQDKRLEKIVARLRTVVAPWLGTLIIVVVAFVFLLRWTEGYATSATWRGDWDTGLAFAGLLLVVRVFTDANRTSLHHFYRERLASAYLVNRSEAADNAAAGRRVGELDAATSGYKEPMRVSRFAAANGNGGPQLVMAAVANVADADYVPAGRGCVPFVIAHDETGVVGDRSLPPNGTQPTRGFEDFADFDGRDLTVPAAMAISGAAFSPLVGRASSRTRPVRVLLTVLNARLGVWLPNPYLAPPDVIAHASAARHEHQEGPRSWRDRWERRWLFARAWLLSVIAKPGPYRLLREAFGQPSLHDRKLYVTDGGHYDNLGLLEALRRRPHEIIVIDASNDRKDSFGALADAIATARMDLGTEVTIDLTDMHSNGDARAPKAWAKGIAVHADGTRTDIVFLKAQLIANLSNDVEHYAADNPDFPRRSTGQQLYDEWDFEAYRELGEVLAERMLDDPSRAGDVTVPAPSQPQDDAAAVR